MTTVIPPIPMKKDLKRRDTVQQRKEKRALLGRIRMILSSSALFLLPSAIISSTHIYFANAFATYLNARRRNFKARAVTLLLSRTTTNSIISSTDNDELSNEESLPNVLCIGETLWDSLPSGIFLGGAPSNVAVHLAYLFNDGPSNNNKNGPQSPTVAVAACLGKDQLGYEARRRLAIHGVRTDYIQYHPKWETGMAIALIDSNGDATYEFNTPAAWDGLCCLGDSNLTRLIQHQQLQSVVENDDADEVLFVMGTIAGRLHNDYGATSLSTLMAVRNTAPEGTVILDINLRSPWYDEKTVLELARGGGGGGREEEEEEETKTKKKLALLKLNEEELAVLERWCGMDDNTNVDEDPSSQLIGDALKMRMENLAKSLNTQRICVTRGENGAALWCDVDTDNGNNSASFDEHPGYSLSAGNGGKANEESDTVGAGDAFLASLINSLFIHGESSGKALERACALGGYVAACRGATPVHGNAPDALREIFSI